MQLQRSGARRAIGVFVAMLPPERFTQQSSRPFDPVKSFWAFLSARFAKSSELMNRIVKRAVDLECWSATLAAEEVKR
jgi:hypothetical protein